MSQSFRARLDQRLAQASQGASEDLWHYREAASVVVSFDYEKLQPFGDVSPSSNAKTELLADCDVEYLGGGTPTWSLRTSIRQTALHRLLKRQGVDAALASNPNRPDTFAQKLLERLLKNYQAPSRVVRASASFGSLEENQALLKVIDWLNGVPEFEGKLPTVEEVKARIAREHLVEPFRQLVGGHFAGRRNELEQLADYVGIHDAYSVSETFQRAIERIRSIHERPPLFINGPGGSGKSTLIGKFILDHATVEQSSRFPFAYLDFDRVGLIAEEPITLLFDIMRQLAIQFPAVQQPYLSLAQDWSSRLSKQADGSEEEDDDAPIDPKNLRLENRESFLSEFADFVKSLKAENQPLLLVLDTFEEIQFRSSAFTDEIFDFLDDLQGRVPRLRTVLSGRADIQSERYKVKRVALGDFDNEAAVSYLAGRKLTDPEVAQRIYEQVGGNPLVLRLAADVAKLEKVDERGIAGLDSWFPIFQKQSIQAVLYKRILSHVYYKRVEEIAYPGLVLRIITPEVLQEILGPACEVSITSIDDARELVKIMKARLSTILVPAGGDDEVLIHRPDMRSILLGDLKATAEKDTRIAQKLTNIHQEAIKFHSKFSDPAQRAEEIYHRLALGIDRKVLATRWMDGLGPFLGSSIRELPQASQVYLAARLELELPNALWSSAQDEDWSLYATRLVDQTLALQKPFEALEVLRQRTQLWASDGIHPVLTKVTDAVFNDYARQYEQIRETQEPGNKRTAAMNSLVSQIVKTAREITPDRSYPREFFEEGGPGKRIVAIAIADAHPIPEHMDLAIAAIKNALSPFEQYHALLLARNLFDQVSTAQRGALLNSLQIQEGTPIHESDPSRFLIKNELLGRFSKISGADQTGSAVSVAVAEEDKDPEGWDHGDAWAQLLYAIWDKSCTPFLGAGACADVLPLGTTIAQRWAEEFDYPFSDSSNLPRVAQFVGIMKSGPLLPRLKIKAEFQDKVPDHTKLDEPHRVLGEFNLPVYITTNYDSFMVNELRRQGKKPIQQCCQWHKAKDISKTRAGGATPLEPTPEKPVVYHLHGYLADPMSMVLTEDDYLNFLINISEENVIPSHIEAAFGTDRAFLFIGYSLDDMSFKVLFRKFGRKMASSPGDRHIAVQLQSGKGLTEDQKRKQREFLEKQFGTQNVRIYWGKASTFLRSLRHRWQNFKP